MPEPQEQQDKKGTTFVPRQVAQAAPDASKTASAKPGTTFVPKQAPAQSGGEVNPETSPQRFNPLPSWVPGVGRPESIPHAPVLESLTHAAGQGGQGIKELAGGIYGMGKDLLFSEGAD